MNFSEEHERVRPRISDWYWPFSGGADEIEMVLICGEPGIATGAGQ